VRILHKRRIVRCQPSAPGRNRSWDENVKQNFTSLTKKKQKRAEMDAIRRKGRDRVGNSDSLVRFSAVSNGEITHGEKTTMCKLLMDCEIDMSSRRNAGEKNVRRKTKALGERSPRERLYSAFDKPTTNSPALVETARRILRVMRRGNRQTCDSGA